MSLCQNDTGFFYVYSFPFCGESAAFYDDKRKVYQTQFSFFYTSLGIIPSSFSY
ncbi:hypothetical protein M2451_003146 [Dysgonomonas sp. PFB1-18]|nr:hypothetical protein [Dysgonomonas sp. PF1-14]MDH6381811.1 hypothetical protein [Dysgonomonas sp. PFB1-18]MDH6398947.1 hypothetical protein [Dysgonomonas sp. PF1-23]